MNDGTFLSLTITHTPISVYETRHWEIMTSPVDNLIGLQVWPAKSVWHSGNLHLSGQKSHQ